MTDLLRAALPETGGLLAGRYRLIERIGSGGMARVYRARDEILGRDVAVKLFSIDATDQVASQRRNAEALALAALDHPSLVTLYDAHIGAADHAFLVMELVPGPTLRERMDQGPLDGQELAVWLSQIAAGLAAVHAAGIVHRDIKPANILLRPTGDTTVSFEAVLADFGIAHLVDAARLTAPGAIMGTAAYLAPEQVRGEATGPASDVYSLGLVVLEALTQRHPFDTDSLQNTIVGRLSSAPAIPGALGYGWNSLISAMTTIDPSARLSASEVADRASRLGTATTRPGPLRRDRRRRPPAAHLAVTTAPDLARLLRSAEVPDEPVVKADVERANRLHRAIVVALVVTAAIMFGGILLITALSSAAGADDTGYGPPVSAPVTWALRGVTPLSG